MSWQCLCIHCNIFMYTPGRFIRVGSDMVDRYNVCISHTYYVISGPAQAVGPVGLWPYHFYELEIFNGPALARILRVRVAHVQVLRERIVDRSPLFPPPTIRFYVSVNVICKFSWGASPQTPPSKTVLTYALSCAMQCLALPLHFSLRRACVCNIRLYFAIIIIIH